MGFDIECIINIQSYPGEYFCPVCRTLVYPNEALQSQCTHLYCKQCMSHVANSTRACPYDGYLVTEADSKPLTEANKTLADNIGKVKVHCLYHRSGCIWEGSLSESSSHCSGCTFGNSPVICNRCGIQIVHREVHDHAQTCPGVYQAPQVAEANQNAAASSGTAASKTYADQSHVVAPPGASFQAQTTQTSTAPPPPGQDTSQQTNASSQAAAAVSAAPTPEQWHQQQYQQYYQQYAGYGPYQQPQQAYQQYYPYQQQVGQYYQQGQYGSQFYAQPQPQSQVQALPQPLPQVPNKSQPPQFQTQPQSQSQSQVKVTPQQVSEQGSTQLQSRGQAVPPQYQHVNPQQQFPTSQQPHPQGHITQPQLQQYTQMPAYQQPLQSMHPPSTSQNNPQPTQPPIQPQAQIQPQQHLQNQPLSYAQQRPPQMNQPTVPSAQPQALHPANPAVLVHQSYQPPQQIPVCPPQQHLVHPHPVTGSLPMHAQIPQQLPLMRPPSSHGLVTNQQPAVPVHVPSNHPAQQQHFYHHAHPSGSLTQQRPVIQPTQQFMPPQSQAFAAPLQSQYGHIGQQQPLQSQGHPQAALPVMQPGSHGYNLPQQNNPQATGLVPQQSQNQALRPLMPTHGVQPQSFPQSSEGFGSAAHIIPMHLASSQASANHNYANREKVASDTSGQVQGENELNVHRVDAINSEAGNFETGIKMEQEATGAGDRSELSGPLVNDAEKEVKKEGLSEPDMQQTGKVEPTGDSFDNLSSAKSLGASAMEEKNGIDVSNKVNSVSIQQESFTADKESIPAPSSATNANGSDANLKTEVNAQHSGHSSYHPSMSQALPPSGPPRPQAPGYALTTLRPQGPEHFPPPGQPLNPIDHTQPPLLKLPHDAPISGLAGPGSTALLGRGSGIFGPPPRSFDLHSGGPQAPTFPGGPPGLVDPHSGIMGRAPYRGPGVPPGRLSATEPNPRVPGVTGLNSSAFGLRDERFSVRAGEPMHPFPVEPLRPFDQAPRPLDNAPPGPFYEGGLRSEFGKIGRPSNFLPPPHLPDVAAERDLPISVHDGFRGKTDPSRAPDFSRPDPGFARHHMDHQTPISPGREYLGRPARGTHAFGEGPRPFHLPPDPVGMSFHENRFPTVIGNMRRMEPDGREHLRFGEHIAPGHHNSHLRSHDPYEQDMLPGHLRRGEMSGLHNFPGPFHLGKPAGFGAFPARRGMEEFSGGFPHHFHDEESFRGNFSNLPRFGEPGFRSNYRHQGFPYDSFYSDDLEPFDKSRKRKPVSMGWCRICKFDCETVEGLDMHSQTREHQRMAMDMVKIIKQQNKKKSKMLGDRAAVVEASKANNSDFEGRESKP